MLEYIRGPLKAITPSFVIIETNGLGHRIYLPQNTFAKLPNLEEPVLLYLSEVIREDAHTLYGFLQLQTRDLFEALRNVSGIGPKSALALIGFSADTETLLMAIQTANIHFLSKAPGVGKKTAERLIIEMKDKVPKFSFPTESTIVQDGINALLNLGYSNSKAGLAVKKALKELPDSPDLSLLITTALKCIS